MLLDTMLVTWKDKENAVEGKALKFLEQIATDQTFKAVVPNSIQMAPKKEHNKRKYAIADCQQPKDFP